MTLVTTDAMLVGTVICRTGQAEPFAPGWPGLPARWTSSAKTGIGSAVSRDSRVWVTLSHGIINEVYYPRVDHACTRDLGFIVTDGQAYFSEEKRDTRSDVAGGARHSGLSDSQRRHRQTLSDREGDPDRSDHVHLTFYWPEAARWEGIDFRVCIE